MKTDLNPFNNKEISIAYSGADEVYAKSAEAIVQFQDPTEFGPDSVIIDLGAGTGVSSLVLFENGAKNLTLVDPSRPMLEEAESKLEDNVQYLCASAENFYANFQANVDIIYSLNSIHLFNNMAESLAGIACALKEDGLFVFNISAPTYVFENIDKEERKLMEENLSFYKKLNEISNNAILSHTIELLEKTLDGNNGLSYTKDKFIEIFKALNFEFLDSNEVYIEVESNYQENIWRMIAQGFIQDEDQLEQLVKDNELSPRIRLRQAQFKFKNKNSVE